MPSTESPTQDITAQTPANEVVETTPKRSPRKTTDKASAAVASKPASATKRASDTKTEIVLKKLRTAKGATIEQLMQATGWQAHSVRGFLSATVKKKLRLNLVSDTGKDGVRRYRVEEPAVSG